MIRPSVQDTEFQKTDKAKAHVAPIGGPNGPLEADEAETKMFARSGRLSLDGFFGSGADWLERFKPFIDDGETVVASPHRVFGPQTNDLVLQLRKRRIGKVILRMTLPIRRLRSCRTRSLVCGPNTLWGLATTVSPSSMKGLKRSSQSAPDPKKPSRLNLPLRANILVSASSASSGPFGPPIGAT